jgi:hypothetical protein
MNKHKIILFLFILFSALIYSQDCRDFQKLDNCRIKISKNYIIYLQHTNRSIGINDTISYNITFYGNRDYIISFCAEQIFYPINIRLMQPGSGKELYNNESHNYNASILITLYNTQNIIIDVRSMAGQLSKDSMKNNNRACVGLDLQYKNIFSGLD